MSNEKIVVNIDSDLESIVGGFLEHRQEDLKKFAQALGKKDFATFQLIGHNLKGVSGGYGFHDMGVIGAEIEENAKAGNLAAIDKNIEKLTHYLANVEIIYK